MSSLPPVPSENPIDNTPLGKTVCLEVGVNNYIFSLFLIIWYVADTTLMAESEEELKSLLMQMKEETEKLA